MTSVRDLPARSERRRQAIAGREAVPVGWRVRRTSQAALVERARASYASLADGHRRRVRFDVRAFGSRGAPLQLLCTADGETVTVRSERALVPAKVHALDVRQLREHLGKLGETPFALGDVDSSGLATGLFIPVSELNHLRQHATEQLESRREWARHSAVSERRDRVVAVVADVDTVVAPSPVPADLVLAADVYRVEDARAAASAGATEIAFDPFLRHPVPAAGRVRALADELREQGIALRLRTPTIVRPTERRTLDKWLDLGLPILSGHLGLVAELAREGRNVVADYAVNCFNQHTAAELFRLGAHRIVPSIELTTDEIVSVVEPLGGARFDVLVYGRPEGMTLEHCVLSAAFDRVVASCRDLCVRSHPLVELTDPAGYTFPVATDSACRNRLLHSRPIEASEFLPFLWRAGVRGFRLLFNVPGDPVADLVARYRSVLDALAGGEEPPVGAVRAVVGNTFTRGHFARAV